MIVAPSDAIPSSLYLSPVVLFTLRGCLAHSPHRSSVSLSFGQKHQQEWL